MKTFALAGNPNCGKTTLFNALTGSTAHVGNWPGVTVDKREGVYKGKEKIAIIDLPGIYSLSPYTPEEVISRNYILDEKPDGIINIVDATNLERNLYLTTQILEMDVPVIIALNMMDEVEKVGDKIDVKALEKAVGVPVVAISALKKTGIKELMDKAAAMSPERKGKTVLGGELTSKIERARQFFAQEEVASPLFHAVKMLENDEIELAHKGAKEVLAEIAVGEDLEAVIADERYKYISANFSSAKDKKNKEVLTKSDKIDRVLTHRIWAIPIFIVILFFIFHLTFSEDLFYIGAIADAAGNPLPSFEDLGHAFLDEDLGLYENFGINLAACFYDGAVFSPGVILTNLLNLVLNYITYGLGLAMGSAQAWAQGLVLDGVAGGIFAVLGFLPQILVLFMFFSILEDSGYMARVAFVLDRIFRRFGLSGRAFMPMIMGFGCSLPATINTRTLVDDKERTATIRVIPFFSCGAKLPILIACGGAVCAMCGFENVDLITYGMYILGVVAAICAVLLMRNTSLKGETPPFIMELPAYHMPGFKNLMLHLWDKTKHFVKKAFTIIFASTVIIWLFSHLNWSWGYLEDDAMNESILASIGKFIQPLFTPLGFGSQLNAFGWVFAVAAITGLIAKENVIATFGTLAACIAALGANVGGIEVGEVLGELEGVSDAVAMASATGITPAAVIAFIAFNMTTIPCFAACATAKAELPKGKFKWTLLFWLVSSYIISSMIYTVGSWWWTLFIWLAVVAVVVTFIVLRNLGKFDICKIFKRKKSEGAK
ncbi:MAG: ferrous iron transporter B [Clostridia bacterium]|nr:ferrous iron transporter B [Clostridia bacterium]